jgi:pyrroline-5-carboxylate reductase
MRISFIGGGNMASALIGGLIARGHPPADLQVVEPHPESRARLVSQFGVTVSEAIGDATLHADVLVLAVKPQHMQSAIAPLAGRLRGQLVVSIAAGTRVASLSQWLGGYSRIVRSMPNTPALIGEGISGLFADASVSPDERDKAEAVLAAAGQTVWVEAEHQIDAITAISGSGPAYVFHFIEALEAAAVELGFDAPTARRLALQTFKGASLLAASGTDAPAVLREKVTSKGGTTEAALQSMAADQVFAAIVRGAQAAYARGQALGKASGD